MIPPTRAVAEALLPLPIGGELRRRITVQNGNLQYVLRTNSPDGVCVTDAWPLQDAQRAGGTYAACNLRGGGRFAWQGVPRSYVLEAVPAGAKVVEVNDPLVPQRHLFYEIVQRPTTVRFIDTNKPAATPIVVTIRPGDRDARGD